MEETSNPISNNGVSKPRFTLTQMRKMTVPQLKIHLSELGLDTNSIKDVLHDCLRSALCPDVTISNSTQGNNSQSLEF